jgi:hypothetical protein
MIYLIIALSTLGYIAMASWTFGYVAGKLAANKGVHDRWFYDEPQPWFAGVFWPGALLFSLFFMRLVRLGTKFGVETIEAKKVRIKLEEKIRVEQEKIEKEAESEIEEALREQYRRVA